MNSFSLHKLPNNAAKLVLRHMEPEEKLAYSFCSKTAKNTVKSLNLSTSMIRFEIGTSIRVTVQINRRTQLVISLSLNLNLDSFPKDQDFNICVAINAIETGGTWSLREYSNQKILYHVLDIFHHPRLDDLVLYDDAIPFEVIEPIWKIVDGVKVGSLTLIWSLREQFRTRLVEKDYNRFLKLWIRGSNPRLKQFHAGGASVYLSLDAELILKGIKYKRISLDSEAVNRRKMMRGGEEETRLAGGYIIRRYNGDDAVVVIKEHRFNFISDCF